MAEQIVYDTRPVAANASLLALYTLIYMLQVLLA